MEGLVRCRCGCGKFITKEEQRENAENNTIHIYVSTGEAGTPNLGRAE